MNYIAHFKLLEKQEPYFVLGNALPDMLRKFSRIHNSKIRNLSVENALVNGIKLHYQVDAIFHNAAYFKAAMELLFSLLLSPALVDVKRKNFIAHLLYEMLLDHALILNDEQIVDRFYTCLEQCEQTVLQKMSQVFMNDDDFEQHLWPSLVNFMHYRFMNRYKSIEGVVELLQAVLHYSKIIEKPFSAKEMESLNNCCYQFLRSYSKHWAEDLLLEIKTDLNA